MNDIVETNHSKFIYIDSINNNFDNDPLKIIDFKKYYNTNTLSPFLIDSNIERLRDLIIEDEPVEVKDEEIQNAISSNHDEVMNYQKQILDKLEQSQEEHKLLMGQISELSEKVAQKDDLVATKNEIINKISSESKEIQDITTQKITELKNALGDFLPHKRTLRVSLYFLTLFSICFFATLFSGLTIIQPFWNFLGILISCGFVLLSIALHKDWEKIEK